MLDLPDQQVWWQGDVRLGKKLNGYWPVTVAEAGTYQFEVCRWPECVDAPISGVPTEQTPGETVVEQKRWCRQKWSVRYVVTSTAAVGRYGR